MCYLYPTAWESVGRSNGYFPAHVKVANRWSSIVDEVMVTISIDQLQTVTTADLVTLTDLCTRNVSLLEKDGIALHCCLL